MSRQFNFDLFHRVTAEQWYVITQIAMATAVRNTHIFDLIRQLTAALIQYPRWSNTKPDVLAHFGKFFSPRILLGQPLPVAGIATRGTHDVYVFFSSQGFKINRLEFDRFFSTEDMAVHERYTGPFIPCAAGGDSVGYGSAGGGTGTLGCVVEDVAKDEYLLSCNHVLANVNAGAKGDPIWQPGSGDGGTAANRIGTLHDFELIDIGSMRPNYMDAAVVKPDHGVVLSSAIRGGVGVVGGTYAGSAYNITVRKFGKTTALTQADLVFQNLSFVMSYPGVGDALFVNQYGILEAIGGIFARNGDSGSLVVSLKNEAVGLLFCVASTGDVAVASPIDPILTRFGVHF